MDYEHPTREQLGRTVRGEWVMWATGQPEPKPSWLLPWEELDADQREVDIRIGRALYKLGVEAGQAMQRRGLSDQEFFTELLYRFGFQDGAEVTADGSMDNDYAADRAADIIERIKMMGGRA